MTTGARRLGEFCWFNMLTPDPPKARAFFAELLGWTYVETGLGHTARVNGHDVGAMFDLASPQTPKGTPPLIGLLARVASADAAAEKVRSLGGQARQPFDLGGAGRLCVCHDPNGAEFDLLESTSLLGTDVDSHAPGAPTWFETITTDLDRAAQFYSALFGWQVESVESGGATFKLDDRQVASAKPRTDDARPHWATHFAVKDADEIARKARQLSAELFAPVTGGKGIRFAGIRSPQGVPFYVMEREG